MDNLERNCVLPPFCRAIFGGNPESFQALVGALPGLQFEPVEKHFWLWGEPLQLDAQGDLLTQLARFCRSANSMIALSNPRLTAIHSCGSVEIVDGLQKHRVCLVEPAHIEYAGGFVTLGSTGRSSGRPPRPLAQRVAELSEREPRFERACNLLAECGSDFTRLYMVAELIERAHGGRPKKPPEARNQFFERLQVEESEWVAIGRSARPHRHAEPHNDDGPVLRAELARVLIHHVLKLWLEREVPN